jgi:hypothetical protein
MMRRFIKLQDKLQELEFPIITAIRRAKSADFAKEFAEMMKKVKESGEIEQLFKQELPHLGGDGGVPKIAFSPLIFDQGKYTLDKSEVKFIPHDLARIHEAFVKNYQQKHPTARLVLVAETSSVESKFHVPKNAKSQVPKTYTVSCDIACFSVINAVASRNGAPVSLREINESIGEHPQTKHYIQRLVGPNSPILKRTAVEKSTLTLDDTFQLNAAFFAPSSRVTVQSMTSERKANEAQVKDKIVADKETAIQAHAVRILKQKQRLTQPELELAVQDALRQLCRADLASIRAQLTALENSQYLVRQTVGGVVMVNYVA